MNYIELINRFWSIDLEANFSHLEVHLYFKLMEINNRLGWKESFKFPNSRLEAEIGSRPKNLINARQRLIDFGLISYKKGTTREAGIYKILSNVGTKESNQESNQGNNEKVIKEVIRGSLTKLNKTKLDNNVSDNSENEISIPENEERKKVAQKKENEIQLPFNGKFKEAWVNWIKYRTEIKKPLKSERGINEQLKFLATNTEADAIEIINQSIRNQWQGLFPLKNKKPTQGNLFKNSEVTIYDDEL